MNPYLEQESVWHDFHERFIPAAAEMLGSQVTPQYVVRIDERIYVRELPEGPRHYIGRADVGVARRLVQAGTETGVALQEAPVKVQVPLVDIERLSYIQILDRNNWQLVTVIELLSPANKYAGPDREQFLAKRSELLASPVHFIEIDLLRGGPRLPLKNLPDCHYYVMVSRAETRPDAGVGALRLAEPLPTVRVPLRAADKDAALDLQALLHRVYDAAQYATYIYRWQPQPALSPEETAWAKLYAAPG
jgi:hypothetical protein